MANSTLLLAMLQNAVILLVLVLVYVISSRPFADELQGTASRKPACRLVSGLLMGGMGILIISTPLNYSADIIFDTRSVLISLAALYFGWLPMLTAAVIMALYRFWLGGAVLTGILTIISSGIIGLLWRHRCRHRLDSLGSAELLAMGLCVHVVLVALMFTLSGHSPWPVIIDITLPMLVGFPLLTLLLGKILSHALNAERLLRETRANAQRLSLAMAVSGQDLFELNLQNGEIHSISTTQSLGKYPNRHLLDNIKVLLDQLHPEDAPLIKELLQAVREGRLEEWKGDFRQYINATEWVWIHVAGRLVSRDEKGKPLTFLGTYLDVTARKLADARLWKQANIDKVTGLPNRSMFLEKLDGEVARAGKNRNQLALIYLDIDHFKEVNDSLGHEAGDLLLQELATRLRGLVRELDLIARIGGDEFTIILTELEEISLAGDTAKAALEAIAEVFSIGGQQVYVGASAGITIYPEDGSSGEILLKNADQAMYKAKNEGRNCYYFFTPAMQEAVNRKAQILSELREALQSSALQVYYQPVVDLSNGAIVKVEALVRWQHPVCGMVLPDVFIPAAEESGLIVPLGNRVLEMVLADIGEMDACCPGLQVSINKSPVQFSSGNDQWLSALAEHPRFAHQLVVEITEGLLLDERPAVHTHLRELQEAGATIAIDDFGTGYSSLSYLKRFQVAFLKIDRSFVRNLAADNEDHSLCEAMITMAHRLGIVVVAEGVESPAQRDLLHAAGCDMGQGYLFSEALPLAELLTLLRSQQQDAGCGHA